MKKILAIILALTMLSVFAACGESPTDTVSQTDETNSTTQGNPDEIYEVVMQFPTLGTTPEDLQMIEDAINARTESEIGVHVTLYPEVAFDLNNATNLMVSSGQKLDLAMSMFEGGVGGYVNSGTIIELDELVEQYGQDIVAAEGIAMSGGYFDGNLYGVPTEEKMARVKAFFARKDLIEKYNIDYDPDHIYTYEELGEIFATVKQGEGDGFYCIAMNASEQQMYNYFDPVDFLGSTIGSGVLLDYGTAGDEIVNYFETENFEASVQYAREWYQNGYFAPDVNTATDSHILQMQSGNYLGSFNNAEPDMIAAANAGNLATLGTEILPFYVSEPCALTQNYQITLWMIPVTCENPEKTMQWLNMMYADVDIINLLYRGIEGTHYEFVGDSDVVIQYANGYDSSTVPYSSMLNVWGDKSKDYVIAPLDETYYDDLAAFNQSATAETTSPALGYCFNSDPVKTQFAAINSVIGEYEASLCLGVVDPAAVLPEFISELKAAGIDEVIAENQNQYNSWKESQ